MSIRSALRNQWRLLNDRIHLCLELIATQVFTKVKVIEMEVLEKLIVRKHAASKRNTMYLSLQKRFLKHIFSLF